MRTSFLAAAAAAVAVIAVPQFASATTTLTLGSTACALSDIGQSSGSCVGWYEGQLLGGGQQTLAYEALGMLTPPVTAPLSFIPSIDFSGSTIDFGKALYGETVIGVHAGGAGTSGIGYQGTAFYEFNAGTTGITSLSFKYAGLSDATLYETGNAGVPEPASWALMLVGVGGLGAVMRSRRKLVPAT